MDELPAFVITSKGRDFTEQKGASETFRVILDETVLYQEQEMKMPKIAIAR